MAASVNCCLKPPSPPATATTTKLTHLSPRPSSNDSGWNRRSMAAAAAAAACVVVLGIATEPVTAVGARRWSEQRMCPSWNTNSLESIVPENLPRPSGRRRIEAVGRSSPPSVGGGPVAVLRHNSNCFSL